MFGLLAVVVFAGVLIAVVVNAVVRALPTIRHSRSFSNTHAGGFVHPDSKGFAQQVGRSLTDGGAKAPKQKAQDAGVECLHLPATVSLSVVVPAYNEEERIEAMLDETIGFLDNKAAKEPAFTYEIVVVNDGSKDRTQDKVLAYSRKHGFDKVRLLNLNFNCGKGAAINKGMRFSRGRLLLFADADGATKFAGVTGLEKKIAQISKNDLGCVVGSRYLNSKESNAERSVFRKFISLVFHALVVMVCGASIKDTQCGFKMFTRRAAQLVFPSQHVDRWAFDVEVLFLCTYFGVPCAEVPVTWFEVGGSKVTLSGVLGMVRDIALIRVLYLLRVWTTKHKAS